VEKLFKQRSRSNSVRLAVVTAREKEKGANIAEKCLRGLPVVDSVLALVRHFLERFEKLGNAELAVRVLRKSTHLSATVALFALVSLTENI
jgi:hypothetical protein